MIHHATRKLALHAHPELRLFNLLAFFKGMGQSAFWTVFPLILLESTQSAAMTGVYFSAISFLLLLSMLLSTLLFTRYSKISITKGTLVVTLVSLVGMTFTQSLWQIVGLDIPRSIAVMLFATALSLFVRDYACKKDIGLAEGKYYFYDNLGWLIGPILGGLTAAHFGNQSVYILTAGLYAIVAGIFFHAHLVNKAETLHHKREADSIKQLLGYLRSFVQKKEFLRVFAVALGLNLWWGISNVYIPLQITTLGFSQAIVGYVISGGILPLVLLERWIGAGADRHGVRAYLISGYMILAGCILSFIFSSGYPVLLLTLFAVVNIGAAFIEPLQETYFFRVANKREGTRYYGMYNTADPIGNIIGPLLGAAFVAVAGMTGLWVASAVLMLLFAWVAFGIKNSN